MDGGGCGLFRGETERERERVRGDLENKDNDAYKIWVLLTLAEVDF